MFTRLEKANHEKAKPGFAIRRKKGDQGDDLEKKRGRKRKRSGQLLRKSFPWCRSFKRRFTKEPLLVLMARFRILHYGVRYQRQAFRAVVASPKGGAISFLLGIAPPLRSSHETLFFLLH